MLPPVLVSWFISYSLFLKFFDYKTGLASEKKVSSVPQGAVCDSRRKRTVCEKKDIPGCSLAYGSQFFKPPDLAGKLVKYNGKKESPENCLIVGLGVGYNELILSPFVKSLRQYMNCEVLLVTKLLSNGSLNAYTESFLSKYEITEVRYDYGKVRAVLQRLKEQYKLDFSVGQFTSFPAALQRYFIYDDIVQKKILSNKHISTSHVLLSDTKDVFFQHDVFSRLHGDVLYGAVEGIPPRSISNQRRNLRWARDCYGPNSPLILDSTRLVLCSGTILGSFGATAEYLKFFLKELHSLTLREHKLPKKVRCIRQSGVDQGIHQHVMWNSNLSKVVHLSYVNNVNDSLIGTVGLDWEKIHVGGGYLMNSYSEKFAMIHQYGKFLEQICQQFEHWT